jgi:tRNA(fMet)-specific endonuclease VapC
MTIRYLLDTNTVSHMAKGDTPSISRQFQRLKSSSIAISAVSEGELLYGLARRPEVRHIAAAVISVLAGISVLPWDSNAARFYGHLRAALEREGKTLGSLDMMIAAHALAEDAVLVTNDAAFRHIDRLRIEDWTRPL